MGRILTTRQLIDRGACNEQVEAFRSRFGESVEVTPELCESVVAVFDWVWAASNLLSARAYAEYQRVRAAARAKYDHARAQAWADHVQQVAWSAYAGYDRVEAAAWAEYERAKARAFGEAYNSPSQIEVVS